MNIVSAYVPVINFRSDAHNLVQDALVSPRIKAFFGARNISNFREVESFEAISSKDFYGTQKIDFSYFYEILLKYISLSPDPMRTVSYTITFDASLATQICADTQTRFSTIDLGSHPVFYFIYIDIQTIFDFLRLHNLTKPTT